MGIVEVLREMLEAARHGAINVRASGSVARGEDGPNSDAGFLVDLEPGRTVIDQAGLCFDLRRLLRRRVDVVTENLRPPRARARTQACPVAVSAAWTGPGAGA